MKNTIVTVASRYAATGIGLAIGFLILGTGLLGNLDLVRTFTNFLDSIEKVSLDEVVLPVVLLGLGVLADYIRSKHKATERLRVLKATMRTVQDIVNNAVNAFQLLRLEAEENSITAESLQLFDFGLLQVKRSIQLLGDVDIVRESQLATGSGIQYDPPNDVAGSDKSAVTAAVDTLATIANRIQHTTLPSIHARLVQELLDAAREVRQLLHQ